MQKSTITVGGVDYIVRTLDVRSIPTFEDDFYADMRVAGESLWDAIEADVMRGDDAATNIDDSFFFYVDDELLRRDATDDEIVEFIKHYLP